MKKLLSSVFAFIFVLASAQSFAQTPGIQNEALKTLANTAGTATKLATDKKGRLLLGGTLGAGMNAVPMSSGTLLGGVASGTVGWNSIGGQTITTGSTTTVIAITGIESTAFVGDAFMIRENSTTTALRRQWGIVTAVATNAITVSPAFTSAPANGDVGYLLRPVPIFAANASAQNGAALEVTMDYNYQGSIASSILKVEDAVAGSGEAVVPIGMKILASPVAQAADGDYTLPLTNDVSAQYTDGVRRGTFTHSNPSVGNASSVTLLASNAARRYLLIQNNSAANVCINLNNATLTGIVPSNTNPCIVLAAGAFYESPPNAAPTAAVTIYQTSGGAITTITTVEAS